MKQFRTVDNLLGWITFAIAAFVYCSTIEPTASFWDCPEFITTGYRLEVGHPPGAPFFMLTANLFSQFTSDPLQVAKMVNMMSALLSASCILLLFWTITHLAKRLVTTKGEPMTLGQMITIEGAGLVGALAYTFSDTFWYSAVEGEVYAYSSAFTALVFWLILKWEEQADDVRSDRWLILIAYFTGLSIGVHLLNLLCLPAIVLVVYYKRCPHATAKGSLMALLGSAALVCAVLYGIVPGIVRVGGWFELLFVNTFGFGFDSGLIFYIVVLVAAVLWALYTTIAGKSRKQVVIAFLLAVALLGIPFYGSTLTTQLGLGLLVLGALAVVMFYKKGKQYLINLRVINTSLLCMLMIMIGYSSYAVIVIRSAANPPMDQNSPEDIFTLGEYLGREQYGSRPLLYGQAYTSQPEYEPAGDGYLRPKAKQGAPVYQRKEKTSQGERDSYELVRYKQDYVYAQNMLFPRMYSDNNDSRHPQAYESWLGGVKGRMVPYSIGGEMRQVKMPTQWENLRYFASYQLNFMYWRYFLWNFAGRQNDIQGHGELEHGNWITGISFIDNLRLGDQELMPSILKENKGRNMYYCLPLILGLIGLFWQAYRGRRGAQQFWVVFFLFFMTGIAIVLYLNQTPNQPRERDYAYAGSFYAFTIWIGLGVAAVAQALRRYKLSEVTAATLATAVCVLIPLQMASQNWDDHDRSGRYVCRDFGQNYLRSLQEEVAPIIFTNGDNDTFPLWYSQDTEGFRTDARVCNLSYLQTHWYIDQMKRPAYDSPALPINWSRAEYVGGKNEYIRVKPTLKADILRLYASASAEGANLRKILGENPFEVSTIMEHFIHNPVSEEMRCIPTDTLYIKIDKEAVMASGMMIPVDSIPDYMPISLKGKNGITKSELMMIEMLANANWSRPLYISSTVGASAYPAGLDNYFIQEGLASRIAPFNTAAAGKQIDTKRMYDNLMNKFQFGGINNPALYLDENTIRMALTHRRLFAQLAKQLVAEGDYVKAEEVLDRVEFEIPGVTVPHNDMSAYGSLAIIESYIKLGKKEKALAVIDQLNKNSFEYLYWYVSMNQERLRMMSREYSLHFSIIGETLRYVDQLDKELAMQLSTQLDAVYMEYHKRGVTQ